MTTGERLLSISSLSSGTTLDLFMNISGGTSLNYPELIYVDITNCSAIGSDDGQLEITASGGTAPYTYSIGGAYQSSNIFTGLSAGTYSISVKDYASLIDSIGGIKLTVPSSGPPSTVIPFIYSLIITDLTQNNSLDGSIKVFASGGTMPYTYSINDNPYQVSNNFSGLPAGDFKINVKDADGLIGGLSGIKVSSQTLVSGGSGWGGGRKFDNQRYKTKVNVKNIKISDTDLNESIKVRVTI